jgi:hypothetical protein
MVLERVKAEGLPVLAPVPVPVAAVVVVCSAG